MNQVATKKSRFLEFYFDPYYSNQDICRALKISKATFHRLQGEINMPKVKIGIGTRRVLLPKKKLILSMNRGQCHFSFSLARLVSRFLRVRAFISFDDVDQVIIKTKKGQYDMAFAGVARTKVRSGELEFSQSYVHYGGPRGKIFQMPHWNLASDGNKPSIGVVRGTIHAEFAIKYLACDYRVKDFYSNLFLKSSLEKGAIKSALIFPGKDLNPIFQIPGISPTGKEFIYNTYTGVIFPHGRDFWIDKVNSALEYIFENRLIDQRDYY